ncbi:hypothetical protein E2320_007075 [Naja naja]|nr:hypothetical protein E2320_007075 [Naja naja]
MVNIPPPSSFGLSRSCFLTWQLVFLDGIAQKHTCGGACTKLDEDILDIPLDDPDANAAAAKIQASFRGHMTRKKIKGGEIERKSKDPECTSSTRTGDLRNGD